ncbi:MAG: translocation/assembly module TamB domain-containing protein [Vicingaceae bacterium]
MVNWSKIIKKAYQAFLAVFDLLFLAYLCIIIAVQFPAVQTALAKKATQLLSSELNTTVRIDRLKLDFLSRLTLGGLYLEDLEGDTLLYTYDLDVSYKIRPLFQGKFRVNGLCLTKAKFYLHKHVGEEKINAAFLFDLFKSSDTSETKIDLRLRNLELKNSSFTYIDHNIEHVKGFDPSNIDLKGVELYLYDARFDGRDFESAELDLSFKSHGGFQLKRLTAEVRGGPGGISLQGMDLLTAGTNLSGNLSFETNSWSNYIDFVDSVKMTGVFKPSEVDFKDIAYFAPALNGVSMRPKLSGIISGTVSDLRASGLKLSLENHTSLFLSFRMTGLPDIDNTSFDLQIEHLRTSKSALEQIALPTDSGPHYVKLPQSLASFGRINLNGRLKGYINDLVAKVDVQTDIGRIQADLKLKNDKELSYKGSLKTYALDLGKLSASPETVGTITMEVNVDGQGTDPKTLIAKIEGNIAQVQLNRYNYSNIKIDGNLNGPRFIGDILVNDENINLVFIGSFDLSKRDKSFNFMAEIEGLRPHYILNAEKFDSTASFSSTINIDIHARDIDSLIGQIELLNTSFTDLNDTVVMNSFLFESEREGEMKNIKLRSDIADFDISGKFDMLDNFSTVQYLTQQHLPNLFPDSIALNKNFDFELNVKDYSLIQAVLTPELWIGEGSNLKGSYNTLENDFKLGGSIIEFSYGSFTLDTTFIEALTKEDILELNLEMRMASETYRTRQVNMHFEASNNQLEAKIRSRRGGPFAADFNFNAYVHKFDSIAFNVVDSRFLLGDSIWKFDNTNKVVYDGGDIQIDGITAFKNEEYIHLDGRLSHDPADELNLIMADFNLSVLNKFIKGDEFRLQGIIDGKASVTDFYGERLFQSNLSFIDLGYNENTIGSGNLISTWQPVSQRLMVNCNLNRGDTNTVKINGYYDLLDESSPLNFKVNLSFIPLKEIELFTIGILSDFSGQAGAVLEVHGTTADPVITGKMGIVNAGLTIDYLNTHYQLQNSEDVFRLIPIYLVRDTILIPDLTLIDEFGNKARSGITLVHNGFKKMDVGIHLHTDRFHVLNTNSAQSDIFYGKVFISGNIDVRIGDNITKLDMDIAALDGTRFSLPLNSGVEVNNNEFIVFEKPDDLEESNDEEIKKEALNLDLKMKVRATPGAIMRLVFDENVGDVLRARGSGDFEVNYNNEKGLDMTGELVIESGDYLFTLETLVNKKFFIQQGSTIKWNGDPLKGVMNITTSYRLRTKLKNILPNIYQDVNYERLTPVELQLLMKDEIESPTFDFNVDLPNTNINGKNQLNALLSSKECMNQQVISLLVLNTFTPCEGYNSDPQTSVGKNQAYETMSNQLSNWLSKISDDVDVGFTYRPEIADQNEVTPEQVEVALSTQLFNDRLILDGNVGYGDQSLNNTTRNTDVVGEFTIEYKIRQDGKLRIKAFNMVNDRSYIENDNLYVQGVGLAYTRDYNTFKQLMKEVFGKKEEEPE